MTARGLQLAALGLVVLRWCLADREDPLLAAGWTLAATLVGGWLLCTRAPAWRAIPVLAAASGLALWALGSTLWSVDAGGSLGSALSLVATCMLGLALAGLPGPWRARLAWSLVLGAALAAAAALRQELIGFPALREAIAQGLVAVEPRVERTAMAGRAFGTFFAPDMLAGGLIAALPVAAVLAAAQRGPRRVLLGLLGLVLAAALIATGSVGGAVALGGGCLAVAGGWAWRRAPRLPAAITAVALVAVLALMAVPRWQGVSARARERLVNQRLAFAALPEAPLLGHGHDSYGVVMPSSLQPGIALTRYAHGLLGQSASDGGLPGVLLGLALVVGAALQARRAWRDPAASALERGAAVGLVAGTLHACADYDLVFGENQLVLWCVAALSCVPPGAPMATRPRLLTGALVALAVLLGVWRGGGLLQSALAARAGSCLPAVQALERGARWFAIDAELARSAAIRLHGCAEAGDDRAARAVQWMERAVARRPRDAILRAELGLSLAMAGRPEAAWPVLAQAQNAWPAVARVHALEGQAALVIGDRDRAWRALERAQRLSREDPVVQRLERMLSPPRAPASQETP